MSENRLSNEYTSVSQVYKEIMLKILIIGDYGVGKTAIARRYTEGQFSNNYKITIGAEFSMKSCMWDEFTQINIQLWDIAGHERFGHMTRVYYKYASAAAIVFDASRMETFGSVDKWLSDVRDKVILTDGSPLPVVVLANKSDIEGVNIPTEQLNHLVDNKDAVAWFSTSAKNNLNITEAMEKLICNAMENRNLADTDSDSSKINLEASIVSSKSRCCI